MQDLKTFSHDIINIVGVTNTTVKCNDWSAKDVKAAVTEVGHQLIIGRDLFSQLGLSLNQSKLIVNVNQNQCPIKQGAAIDFIFALISHIRKSRKYFVKITFPKSFIPTQQKSRRVPINLQFTVKTELKK